MNTPASTLTPLVILFVSAASYFICNWQLFAYLTCCPAALHRLFYAAV